MTEPQVTPETAPRTRAWPVPLALGACTVAFSFGIRTAFGADAGRRLFMPPAWGLAALLAVLLGLLYLPLRTRFASRAPAVLAALALALGTAYLLVPWWLTLAAVVPALWVAGAAAWPHLKGRLDAHTDAVDRLPETRLGPWIALAAAAGLFAELVLIRWHASCFQLFAYFKNVSLLAGFLGLGLGYVWGHRRPLLTPLTFPAIAAQVAVIQWLRLRPTSELLQNPVSEQLTLGMKQQEGLAPALVSYSCLFFIFAATVLACLPLGQLASRLMKRLPPLRAYGWNLAGSLAGVALFTGVCFLWSPPVVWFLVLLALIAPFLLRGGILVTLLPTLASGAVAIWSIASPETGGQEIHSPYQVLWVTETNEGRVVCVNNVYFQRILDLRRVSPNAPDSLKQAAAYYDFPYRLKPRPDRVLVVGSGTGNDVAAALRGDAGHVDAVEIDPAILQLGRRVHPERPYDDPRVETFVQDARHFIKRTDRRYDLIVYGLLDSHTLLSGASSVRLDGFVYTREALQEARQRLTDRGLVVLTFSLASEQMETKLFRMLRDAFDGQEPMIFKTYYDQGRLFLIGPGLADLRLGPRLREADISARVRDFPGRADVTTDDWPFFYMPAREYPKSYLVMVGLLVAVSVLLLLQFAPAVSRPVPAAFFFLGAGFMLVETRGIAQLALTLGSTWHVTAAVIAGVLVMAFLANLLVDRMSTTTPAVLYGLLAVALVLQTVVPARALLSLPPALEGVVACALATLPLFFSGMAFSRELRRAPDFGAAMSANLLGSMLGGLLEYNSMYFGISALSWFAIGLYALAYVAARRTSAA